MERLMRRLNGSLSRSVRRSVQDVFQQSPLDLRFALKKALDPRVTFTRASNGTYVGSNGVLQTAANDVPRFDHNPTTGESLGLLVEEQRTNSIRNNTMVGAVAGTPGTAPTNWTTQSSVSGLTRTIVGTGTESGITYIDVLYSGTTTGAVSAAVIAGAETNAQVAASTGQTWTASWYVRLIGGSTSGISQLTQQMTERDATGTIVAGSTQTSSILTTVSTAPLIQQRITQTRTLNGATTAFLTNEIRFAVPTATAIDITLRIGLPQLEQGAFATSVIPTTGTAATRSADVASITGTNFSSWYRQDEGTVFAEVDRNTAITAATTVVSINDNTTNNRLFNFRQDSSSQLTVISQTGGILDASPQVSLTNTSARNKVAAAQALNNLAASANGGTAVADSSVAIPTVNQMQIGNVTNVSVYNGTIRRLTYWPQRLSSQTLQTISGPALPAPAVSDPYFSSVSLLLHMNGSNGSTTFTDTSIAARTVTVTGNTQISTTQSKFGGASGYFDGTNDYLTVADASAFSFGAGLFTIEGWFYASSLTATRALFTMPRILGGFPTLIVLLNTSGIITAYCSTTGGSFDHYMNTTAAGAVVANTWNHFSYVRTGTGGNDYRVFLNGVINSPGNATYSSSVLSYPNVNQIRISDEANATFGSNSWLGYIDDVRVTTGVARYTANFTPPTAAFPDN